MIPHAWTKIFHMPQLRSHILQQISQHRNCKIPHATTKIPWATTKIPHTKMKRSHMPQLKIPHAATKVPYTTTINIPHATMKSLPATIKKTLCAATKIPHTAGKDLMCYNKILYAAMQIMYVATRRILHFPTDRCHMLWLKYPTYHN